MTRNSSEDRKGAPIDPVTAWMQVRAASRLARTQKGRWYRNGTLAGETPHPAVFRETARKSRTRGIKEYYNVTRKHPPVKPKKGCDGRFTFVPRPMREADRSAEAGAVLSVPRGVAELARRGYPVFPLSAQTKQPAVEGGFYAATTDLDTLAARAQDRPSCDWAMATGVQSGVVVIDADTPTAARLMADAYGPPDAETRRGAHWYFRHPQDGKVTSTRGFLPDLDRKGDGGYVAVPPSANKTWNFGIPDRGALPILPADLRGGKRGTDDASHGGTVNTDAADAIAAVMPAGGRHDLMLMLAGVMLRREAAANVTATLLKAWDQAGALSSAARADIWSICVSESSGTSEAAFAPSSESSSATVSSLSIDSNFTAGSS